MEQLDKAVYPIVRRFAHQLSIAVSGTNNDIDNDNHYNSPIHYCDTVSPANHANNNNDFNHHNYDNT